MLSESKYLHCGSGRQNAVTHTGKTDSMYVVSFQWKPPASYQGLVRFRATVVQDYKTFWTGISSPPVTIIDSGGVGSNAVVTSDDNSDDMEEPDNIVVASDQYKVYEDYRGPDSSGRQDDRPVILSLPEDTTIRPDSERDYYFKVRTLSPHGEIPRSSATKHTRLTELRSSTSTEIKSH